jgi:rod shape-determining protein MreC
VYKISQQSKNWIVSALIVIVFSVLFSSPLFRRGFSGFFRKLILVPVNFFSNVEARLGNKKEILVENISLIEKVAFLSIELKKYEELAGENERLRELLDFKKKVRYDTVSAEVIARNPNNWISSFYINKGCNDGVKPGAAVCSSDGLLGKVTEAGEDSSTVMLITHPGFKTGGTLKVSRINGIITGAGMDRVKMLYLPVDADIKTGEEVITSGFSGVIPEGLLIGKISSVEKSKTGLYQYAFIKPAVDSCRQEEVLCVKE